MRQSQRHSKTPTKQQQEKPVKNKLEVQDFCLSHKYTVSEHQETEQQDERDKKSQEQKDDD